MPRQAMVYDGLDAQVMPSSVAVFLSVAMSAFAWESSSLAISGVLVSVAVAVVSAEGKGVEAAVVRVEERVSVVTVVRHCCLDLG